VSLAEALGAEFVSLKDAGHNDVLSNPHWEKFASRVVGFLTENKKKNGAGG
jgi:hypothetical protein